MAFPWRTLLVPHDFSACSRAAAATALAEAKVHGAEVVLLHVVELVPQFGPDTTLMVPEDSVTPIGMHAYFARQAAAELAEVARGLAGDVAIRCVVREGVPVEQILATTDELHANAIVMGTHGRTGLRHALVGSVAERVLRASPVPVLIVRSAAAG